MDRPESKPQVILSIIRKHPKGVPYEGSQREYGSINHGFMNVKGKPEEAATIPEVADNVHLKNAVVALSREASAFFTIGCEKALSTQDGQASVRGYLEVAFNSKEATEDPHSYFTLFYGFNNYVRQNRFDADVQFHWELERNVFHRINPEVQGFSAAVWTTTEWQTTPGVAWDLWGRSLDFLLEYLLSYEAPSPPRMY